MNPNDDGSGSAAFQALESLMIELFPWIPGELHSHITGHSSLSSRFEAQEEIVDPLVEWMSRVMNTPVDDPKAHLGSRSSIDRWIVNPLKGFQEVPSFIHAHIIQHL